MGHGLDDAEREEVYYQVGVRVLAILAVGALQRLYL